MTPLQSQCCSCHHAMSSYVRDYSHADYIAFGNQQKSVVALCMNSYGVSADYEPLNGQLNVNGISLGDLVKAKFYWALPLQKLGL